MGLTGGRTPANRRTRPESGRWSATLARVAASLVLFVYVAGISVNAWLERRIGLGGAALTEQVVLFAGLGMFAVVGALLVARRPGNPIGWIMGAAALIAGVFPAGETYAAYVMTTRGRPDALAVVGVWANGWYWLLLLSLILVYLPLLFPDGRLLSRRWLPFAVLPGIATFGVVVLGALSETLKGQNVDYRIENPIGIEGLAPVEELPVFAVFSGLLFIGVIGAFASVAVRFRRSRGVERQQLKWFVYAAAPILAFPLIDVLPEILNALMFGWVFFGLPTAIGISILRYRLYDIDLVINRTLVYAVLTASLVLVYFGGVAGLQRLLSPLVGEGNGFAVVASTLLIAALFQPLRRRVQGFIDRRFYREKYDARKTLETFSATLRDETDLDRLADEMVSVVRETMQPARASLWLRPSHDASGVRQGDGTVE